MAATGDPIARRRDRHAGALALLCAAVIASCFGEPLAAPVRARTGTLRAATVAATWRRFAPVAPRIGLTRLAELTRLCSERLLVGVVGVLQLEVLEYRLRWWDKGTANGSWTDAGKATVAP